eukprot:scaffold102279_cov63-Phaeocystis_antarctica.AAC.2
MAPAIESRTNESAETVSGAGRELLPLLIARCRPVGARARRSVGTPAGASAAAGVIASPITQAKRSIFTCVIVCVSVRAC